jgi:hypothetical protein
MMQTLIQAIMSTYEARENCVKSGNQEWLARHAKRLRSLISLLPSGAGIDNGTKVIDIHPNRVKLECDFHHMTDHGVYDGWTTHTIRILPDWCGISIKISGRNRNDIKDYLHDVYYSALTAPVEYVAEDRYRFDRPSADEIMARMSGGAAPSAEGSK